MNFSQYAFANADDPEKVHNAINFVRDSNDPDILGLTSRLSNELETRIDWGINSFGIQYKVSTMLSARFLLARILLEQSTGWNSEVETNYSKSQLESMAYGFYKKGSEDPIHNWYAAQRQYVRQGLQKIERTASGERPSFV